MKKIKPVNFKRLFILPLILTTVFIGMLSYLIYGITINKYQDQVRLTALQTARNESEKIEEYLKYQDLLINSINQSLLTSASIVLEHRDELSNDYLKRLTEITEAEYLYFYDSNGTILFDSSELYVGWTASIGDPVYQFMMSGEDVFHEDIRKSLEEDNYYIFTYLRDEDGYFVQAGIRAETVIAQTNQYEYQTIIENIVENNDNLAYALIVDKDFKAIADTDPEDIGVIYENDADYTKAFSGEGVVGNWYYRQLDITVLEAAYPIYHDGVVVNVLGVGYSLESFFQSQMYLMIAFITLSISFMGIFFLMQYLQLFRPLSALNDTIAMLDVESKQEHSVMKENNVFSGIYLTLDQLSKRITEENAKNYRLNKRIASMAYSDFLTGIPNRLAFIEKLNEALTKFDKIAIVFFDLDGFKSYNDTLGHTFGDALLKSFTKRFEPFNDENTCFARYGGDEFFMYHHYETMVDLRSWLENISSMFDHPFEVDNLQYPLDSGIGVSLYPEDDTSVEHLIRKADIAMYYSKKRGKNFIEFYNNNMEVVVRKDNEIIKKMKQAIKNDGFTVVYQPQVNSSTGEIVSMEALLRIKDETLSPAVFIPLAEQGGIINMIGRIVIKTVIQQLSEWKSKGKKLVPVYLNLSSLQLEDVGLLDYVKEILYDHQIDSTYLGFEMTESAVIRKEKMAFDFLMQLNEMNIHTAIDDFGSGYAGLSYLTKYRVEFVKLDRHFCVKYLNSEGLPIFNNIVNLTKLLGFKVLAEGIETEEQLSYLKQTDCHFVQGYYYYLPSDSQTVSELLDSNQRDTE